MPEIQSGKNAWSSALLGTVIALLGVILAGGGAYLAALGGSWYYVAVGAFAFTSVWTFWEIGLSGWQLIPRLVGPFVLLVLAILVAPTLDQTRGRRARKLGLAGAGIFVVALAILIPIFNQQLAARPLPGVRADAFFEDPGSPD
jgi:quinoprotein glucose dehydrogenase